MMKQLGALQAQKQVSSASAVDSDAPVVPKDMNVAPPAALANDLNDLDDDDSPKQPAAQQPPAPQPEMLQQAFAPQPAMMQQPPAPQPEMMQQPPAPQPAMMQQPPAPVQEQPVMQPAPAQSAMIDTAGPDEAPAAMPEMPQPSHYRSKSDWLSWKPHDDTAQVAGMLKQLGALQGHSKASKSFAPVEDSAPPAAPTNDQNSENNEQLSGPSWGNLVPPQLAAKLPPRPAPQPVLAQQPEPEPQAAMPVEASPPEAPKQGGFLQQTAQQPSAPAGPAPKLDMGALESMGLGSLKAMDPNQLAVVQSLLSKQQQGVAIPGLQHHERKDPNDDPAVQLLAQNSGSMVASQVSDDSGGAASMSASSTMASSADSAMSNMNSMTSSEPSEPSMPSMPVPMPSEDGADQSDALSKLMAKICTSPRET